MKLNVAETKIKTCLSLELEEIIFAKIVILIHFVHDTAINRAKKQIKTLKKNCFFFSTT